MNEEKYKDYLELIENFYMSKKTQTNFHMGLKVW